MGDASAARDGRGDIPLRRCTFASCKGVSGDVCASSCSSSSNCALRLDGGVLLCDVDADCGGSGEAASDGCCASAAAMAAALVLAAVAAARTGRAAAAGCWLLQVLALLAVPESLLPVPASCLTLAMMQLCWFPRVFFFEGSILTYIQTVVSHHPVLREGDPVA